MTVPMPTEVCAALDQLRSDRPEHDLRDLEATHALVDRPTSDWIRSHHAAFHRAVYEGWSPAVAGVPCPHEWVEHDEGEHTTAGGSRRCELCDVVEERQVTPAAHAHTFVPVASADGLLVTSICSVCRTPAPRPHEAMVGL